MWHTGSRLFEPFTWLVSAPTMHMLVTVMFINGKKWLAIQEKFTMLLAGIQIHFFSESSAGEVSRMTNL